MTDYAAFAEYGVATVYEAAGRKGLIDAEFHQLIPGSRVAGPARTVACGQDDNLMVHAAIERIRPGEIVILTMPEPRPVALIGDLLVTQIRKKGAAGVLVDASVRDAADLATMGLPIFARYIRVRGATKDILGELDVPVTVGGATIEPGDVVILDADGACYVPAARAAEVLAASKSRVEKEAASRARYEAGEVSLDVNGLRSVIDGMRTAKA
jgi:4-hydroxy-4-methyl-2-oxoglutarate aldolase